MNPENEEVLLEKVREIEKQKRVKRNADEAVVRENTANILKEKRHLSEPLTPEAAKKQMSHRSRRNFLIGGVTALAGVFGWRWMSDETKNELSDQDVSVQRTR